MSDIYGVQTTGYVRKPISVILAELEAAMITEFGAGVIQTPQSPLGQINGLMADLLAEVDERNLDLYQSYDPDQAEGVRLDILGRMRLVNRGLADDAEFRRAITNQGQSRVDIQNVEAALSGIDGVTYSKMFLEGEGFSAGTVAIAVLGGDEEDIADAMRLHVVPGINTYGNTRVTSTIDGFCRTYSIIRPLLVTVTLEVQVRADSIPNNCPPPSTATVRQAIVDGWLAARENGQDVTHYALRSIVETQFPGLELARINGTKDGVNYGSNIPVPINFLEIAEITTDDVEVTLI